MELAAPMITTDEIRLCPCPCPASLCCVCVPESSGRQTTTQQAQITPSCAALHARERRRSPPLSPAHSGCDAWIWVDDDGGGSAGAGAHARATREIHSPRLCIVADEEAKARWCVAQAAALVRCSHRLCVGVVELGRVELSAGADATVCVYVRVPSDEPAGRRIRITERRGALCRFALLP